MKYIKEYSEHRSNSLRCRPDDPHWLKVDKVENTIEQINDILLELVDNGFYEKDKDLKITYNKRSLVIQKNEPFSLNDIIEVIYRIKDLIGAKCISDFSLDYNTSKRRWKVTINELENETLNSQAGFKNILRAYISFDFTNLDFNI